MTGPEGEIRPPCGTYRAHQRHKRRGEPVDDECRIAANEFVAQWRAKNAERNRQVRRNGLKLRRRAIAILRERHPDLYADALKEARREERSAQQD